MMQPPPQISLVPLRNNFHDFLITDMKEKHFLMVRENRTQCSSWKLKYRGPNGAKKHITKHKALGHRDEIVREMQMLRYQSKKSNIYHKPKYALQM